MARSEGQKLKILYILQMLEEHTDEEHPMSTAEIISRLSAEGISCERKTIYSDIAGLVDFGYDIIQVSNRRGGGYYMADRKFELAELKLLVDVVQSSRFITPKKSRELIGKLEKMAGKHEAGQLQRQVYVAGRIKAENESIYYNIDYIHRAIQEDRQIGFTYLEWNLQKKLVPKGERRKVSPWALIWRDENYYLAAYDAKDGILKHYRVDKMGSVEVLPDKREGLAQFERLDLADYTNRTFGMYGGEEETVTMRFPNRLVGVVLDRFGKDADIRPMEDESFRIRAKVAVSGQFFGWLAGIGPEARIVSPERTREQYSEWITNILNGKEDDG
ncbi:MAG: WYL domain-containing protein [Clostridium sp.]|nr:WYL domain-containing protein [Acetatifactor muris]MCM1526479.1 WYL domain-containing protein [Bacteroides sp.]MCM1562395.1 WYL domain-containing protein [Clostridium sp.]